MCEDRPGSHSIAVLCAASGSWHACPNTPTPTGVPNGIRDAQLATYLSACMMQAADLPVHSGEPLCQTVHAGKVSEQADICVERLQSLNWPTYFVNWPTYFGTVSTNLVLLSIFTWVSPIFASFDLATWMDYNFSQQSKPPLKPVRVANLSSLVTWKMSITR